MKTCLSSGFLPNKRPVMRAITNRGQLQNNCPQFVLSSDYMVLRAIMN